MLACRPDVHGMWSSSKGMYLAHGTMKHAKLLWSSPGLTLCQVLQAARCIYIQYNLANLSFQVANEMLGLLPQDCSSTTVEKHWKKRWTNRAGSLILVSLVYRGNVLFVQVHHTHQSWPITWFLSSTILSLDASVSFLLFPSQVPKLRCFPGTELSIPSTRWVHLPIRWEQGKLSRHKSADDKPQSECSFLRHFFIYHGLCFGVGWRGESGRE